MITEIYDLIQDNYYAFLNEFEDEGVNIEEIENTSVLIDKGLIMNELPAFVSVTKENCPLILEKFDFAIEKSKNTHFDELKFMCKCYCDPENLLGKYVTCYLNMIFDIKQHNPCQIITTAHEAYTVRSLAIAAASTLEIPVFNMNKGQISQELVTTDFENFGIGAYFPLPIEARYNFKKIIDRACVNKHSLITFTIQTDIDTSFTRGILEAFNDIISASTLKSGHVSKLIHEAVQKLKKDMPNLKFLLDEQLMPWIQEQIRTNTTIIIIVETEQYLFARIPNKQQSVLEQIKNSYLPLYKSSRLVAYNMLKAPYVILEGLVIQESFLNKWALDVDYSILSNFYMKYQELTKDEAEAEYTMELFCYFADKILKKNQEKIEEKLRILTQVIKKAEFLDFEVEHSHKKLSNLDASQILEIGKLQEIDKEKEKLVLQLKSIENNHFMSDFLQDFEMEKAQFTQNYEMAKANFEGLSDSMSQEDFEELATMAAYQPGLILVAAGLSKLISTKVKPLQIDKLEQISKPILILLSKNFREIQKKLKRLRIETIPDLSSIMNNPILRDFPNVKGQRPFRALLRILETCHHYKLLADQIEIKRIEWIEAEKDLPLEKEQLRNAARREVESKLRDLESSRDYIKHEIQQINIMIDTINNLKPKAAVLTRAMRAHRTK